MAGKTIHAAGGIVVRKGARPLIAVVQRAKDELWVLPRGKLKRDESPIAGARREVMEETGHRVRVREFLGAITYRARGRPKIVQFWRMQAERRSKPRCHERHRCGRLAAAVRGGQAPELPAREIVSPQCRPNRAAQNEASVAAQDAKAGFQIASRGAARRARLHKSRLRRAAASGVQRAAAFRRRATRARASILRRVLGRLSQ